MLIYFFYIYIYRNLITSLKTFIIETEIDFFMDFLRTNWPAVNISPKLHMLEEHTTPFLRKWGVGLGFYGEQGGESLHHQFKAMQSRYKNIRNPLERLRYMMNQHLKNTNPFAQDLQPEVSHRKFKRKHED